jgi:hypothetical protein
MPKSYKDIELSIENTLVAMAREENPNIRHFAREFGVPYSRLLNRHKGRDSRSNRVPTNRLLSEAEESALCRYIEILDNHDLSPTPRLVEKAANSILREGRSPLLTPPPTIGGHWINRFFNRHPEYKIQRIRAIDVDRKKAHEPAIIQDWFSRLKKVIEEHGIHESDIWNFDETGFNIGIGRDQWIVTCEFKKPLYRGSNTNREYATVVEAVNATGDIIPPFIILSGQCILRGWFNTIDFTSYIGVSETGYMNDLLTY